MCLIVVKNTKDSSFSVENFERSHSRNSDGMGIMWVEGGRVKVERVLGNLKQQRKVYLKHMNKPLFVLHQRYATHGSRSMMMENCHPYKIMDMDDGDPIDMYMAHNGVIGDAKTANDKMSDTWNFIESHIKPIIKTDPELLWDSGVQALITKFIGTFNKLVFLTNVRDNELLIFNKPQGSEVNGCWLSNTHSINATHSYNNSKHYQQYYTDDDYDAAYCAPRRSILPFRSNYDYKDGKYFYDGKTFDFWEDFSEYKKKKEQEEELNKRGKLLDKDGNVLNIGAHVKTQTDEEAEAAELELEEYKKELKQAVIDGTMTIDEVKGSFSEEELIEMAKELDVNDELASEEEEKLSEEVRAIYDPENVDPHQMEILVEKFSKHYNYVDLETLIDIEPQVAADMLEFLLTVYVSNTNVKAA